MMVEIFNLDVMLVELIIFSTFEKYIVITPKI